MLVGQTIIRDGVKLRNAIADWQGERLSVENGREQMMNNITRHPQCCMRTSLGNCDPIGGFCTSVSESVCEALHKVNRPQGKWIDKGWKGDWQFETDGRGNCWHEYECSECGFHKKGGKSNYCPNCGCRMKGTKIVGKHADQMIIDEACMKGADDETH